MTFSRSLCNAAPLSLAIVALLASFVAAGDTPFSARAGLEVATDAAKTWAPDAQLVYIENDEDVGDSGAAVRWGYLFYSHGKGETRGYSVRGGRIIQAAELDFDFEAPPLPEEWIDSREALAAAHKKAASWCAEHNGRLSTMLLIRGAFNDRDPDASTWTLLYTSADEPGLFVVVDARAGKVIRTWKG